MTTHPSHKSGSTSRAGGMTWFHQPRDALGLRTLVLSPQAPALLRRFRSGLVIEGLAIVKGFTKTFKWIQFVIVFIWCRGLFGPGSMFLPQFDTKLPCASRLQPSRVFFLFSIESSQVNLVDSPWLSLKLC